eukprot:3716445-Prymnesium_polylepis.1
MYPCESRGEPVAGNPSWILVAGARKLLKVAVDTSLSWMGIEGEESATMVYVAERCQRGAAGAVHLEVAQAALAILLCCGCCRCRHCYPRICASTLKLLRGRHWPGASASQLPVPFCSPDPHRRA